MGGLHSNLLLLSSLLALSLSAPFHGPVFPANPEGNEWIDGIGCAAIDESVSS